MINTRGSQLLQKANFGFRTFRHPMCSFVVFTAAYGTLLYRGRKHKNDIWRIALAGSLAKMLWEVGFHSIDTINMRSKLHPNKMNTYRMMSEIYTQEGVKGFSKGISACYYGSIVWGFLYFSLYKQLKVFISKRSEGQLRPSQVCLSSSFVAEMITLLIYYPYDLVKSRMQTSNHKYKYTNVFQAFHKEITENGISALYKGGSIFLLMFSISIPIQFTLYEVYIMRMKEKYGDKYSALEMYHIIVASVTAGGLSSGLTNWLEVLTIKKQTSPEQAIKLKRE